MPAPDLSKSKKLICHRMENFWCQSLVAQDGWPLRLDAALVPGEELRAQALCWTGGSVRAYLRNGRKLLEVPATLPPDGTVSEEPMYVSITLSIPSSVRGHCMLYLLEHGSDERQATAPLLVTDRAEVVSEVAAASRQGLFLHGELCQICHELGCALHPQPGEQSSPGATAQASVSLARCGLKASLRALLGAAAANGPGSLREALARASEPSGPGLLSAAIHSRDKATVHAVLTALESAGLPSGLLIHSGPGGMTPLHQAAMARSRAVLSLLLSHEPAAYAAWDSLRAGPCYLTPQELFLRNGDPPLRGEFAPPSQGSPRMAEARVSDSSAAAAASDRSDEATSRWELSGQEWGSSVVPALCRPTAAFASAAACLALTVGLAGIDPRRAVQITAVLALLLHGLVPLAHRFCYRLSLRRVREAASLRGLEVTRSFTFLSRDAQQQFDRFAAKGSRALLEAAIAGVLMTGFQIMPIVHIHKHRGVLCGSFLLPALLTVPLYVPLRTAAQASGRRQAAMWISFAMDLHTSIFTVLPTVAAWIARDPRCQISPPLVDPESAGYLLFGAFLKSMGSLCQAYLTTSPIQWAFLTRPVQLLIFVVGTTMESSFLSPPEPRVWIEVATICLFADVVYFTVRVPYEARKMLSFLRCKELSPLQGAFPASRFCPALALVPTSHCEVRRDSRPM
uniref:Uncharacterized protein n=1 Tax=Tetraselmis sp. GSL018 TaxID=582737 RepID=A0A061RX37_9CHLO